MRPALQRLLARPSSLEFLRFLVGTPVANSCVTTSGISARHASALALKQNELSGDNIQFERRLEERVPPRVKKLSRPAKQDGLSRSHAQDKPKRISDEVSNALNPTSHSFISLRQLQPPGYWKAKMLPMSSLELESNLADQDPTRLLNQIEHISDIELWIYLLEYRKNRYGDAGVVMFWEALLKRGIHIPTKGEHADALWNSLLNLQFNRVRPGLVEEICQYADQMHRLNDFKWRGGLYLQIMKHLLVAGSSGDVEYWHKQLEKDHAPSDRNLLRLFYEVISQRGNMPALMKIYKLNKYRNMYDKAIPRLCATDQHRLAVQWHFLFLENGDLPTSLRDVQPLLKYLTKYGTKSCGRVIESLEVAGVSFLPDMHTALWQITPQNSREVVSEVHSKTFYVREKEYNDTLGARWLATGWVSLDTAIKSIHALGVQEIGPLSLQSIALRESHTAELASRIRQLNDLGISIGKSRYSLAIKRFALNNRQDHLDLLLQSDQHPTSFEDRKLQERLLKHFSMNNQWDDFRLTIEVLSADAFDPTFENQNILLRHSLKKSGSISFDSIRENVLDMLSSGVPIERPTMRPLINAVLGSRATGHRPNYLHGESPGAAIANAVTLLREITHAGSCVPIVSWKEIIRRLGMMGDFPALERLCLQIAEWYSLDGIQHRVGNIPRDVNSNNLAHPLRQFFSDSLQQAIVEWAFIHSLASTQINRSNTDLKLVSGIRLLNKLGENGVFINHHVVRKAVLNRMVIYYGQGNTNKSYNRVARERLNMSLEELARQVNNEIKHAPFVIESVQSLVEDVSRRRTMRMTRRTKTDVVGRLRSGL